MVRFIAMISIILCHIMQNLGNISCYYLNVGVWLFLFISGFLYGKKDISNVTVFYKKRARSHTCSVLYYAGSDYSRKSFTRGQHYS